MQLYYHRFVLLLSFCVIIIILCYYHHFMLLSSFCVIIIVLCYYHHFMLLSSSCVIIIVLCQTLRHQYRISDIKSAVEDRLKRMSKKNKITVMRQNDKYFSSHHLLVLTRTFFHPFVTTLTIR